MHTRLADILKDEAPKCALDPSNYIRESVAYMGAINPNLGRSLVEKVETFRFFYHNGADLLISASDRTRSPLASGEYAAEQTAELVCLGSVSSYLYIARRRRGLEVLAEMTQADLEAAEKAVQLADDNALNKYDCLSTVFRVLGRPNGRLVDEISRTPTRQAVKIGCITTLLEVALAADRLADERDHLELSNILS